MSGDVGIEGRLVDTRTDAGIMEFKAYNTDPITLFSVKEFERFAFDKRNLRLFASGISSIFKDGPSSYIPKTGQIDLNRFKRISSPRPRQIFPRDHRKRSPAPSSGS